MGVCGGVAGYYTATDLFNFFLISFGFFPDFFKNFFLKFSGFLPDFYCRSQVTGERDGGRLWMIFFFFLFFCCCFFRFF